MDRKGGFDEKKLLLFCTKNFVQTTTNSAKNGFKRNLSDTSSMDYSMLFLQDPVPDVASLNLKEGCVMLRMDARVQKEGGRS